MRVAKKARRVPLDPWKAFAYLVNKCAEGVGRELLEQGFTDAQARRAIIGAFLDMAAGEACRIARSEKRVPNQTKWRAATDDAFERAVKRTENFKAFRKPQARAAKKDAKP